MLTTLSGAWPITRLLLRAAVMCCSQPITILAVFFSDAEITVKQNHYLIKTRTKSKSETSQIRQ